MGGVGGGEGKVGERGYMEVRGRVRGEVIGRVMEGVRRMVEGIGRGMGVGWWWWW